MTAPLDAFQSALSEIAAGVAKAGAALAKLDDSALNQTVNYTLSPPFSNMTREDWIASIKLWLDFGPKLIKRLPKRGCPACGSAAARKLFESYDAYPFSECASCGAWFVPKLVTMDLFEEFFHLCPDARQIAHKMLEGRLASGSEKADRERIGAYIDELLFIAGGSASKNVSYLDYGCGVGNSLTAARERGIYAVGIEADSIALALARSRGHEVCDTSQSLPKGLFELISFWESLEHMAEPLAVLQSCVSHLGPNGLIAITVPNRDSPIVTVMRGDCPYVHGGTNSPGHINLFSVASMEKLLDRAGLVMIHSDVQYSNNPIDLFTYLFGRNRGVADMLRGDDVSVEVPEVGMQVLNSIWPSINLIERLLLTGPILKVIACRRDAAPRFAENLARLRQQRSEEVVSTTGELLGTPVDATEHSVSLVAPKAGCPDL